jgi:hypothetical protein
LAETFDRNFCMQEHTMKGKRKFGAGMALGIAIGAAVGVAFRELAIGVGAGVALGAGLGFLMSKFSGGPRGTEVSSETK